MKCRNTHYYHDAKHRIKNTVQANEIHIIIMLL